MTICTSNFSFVSVFVIFHVFLCSCNYHIILCYNGHLAWELNEGVTSGRNEPSWYEMLHSASELFGSCECGNIPLGSIKDREFLG